MAEFAHGKTFEVGIVPGDTLEAELRRSTTSQSFGLVLSCITEKTGVVVRNVLPNSPAANSTDQLQPNDLVVMINDSVSIAEVKISFPRIIQKLKFISIPLLFF